jgi:hypothetical protein
MFAPHRDIKITITAGICGPWNGVQRHFAQQQIGRPECRYGSIASFLVIGPMSVVTPKATVVATGLTVAKCQSRFAM